MIDNECTMPFGIFIHLLPLPQPVEITQWVIKIERKKCTYAMKKLSVKAYTNLIWFYYHQPNMSKIYTLLQFLDHCVGMPPLNFWVNGSQVESRPDYDMCKFLFQNYVCSSTTTTPSLIYYACSVVLLLGLMLLLLLLELDDDGHLLVWFLLHFYVSTIPAG